ncbi:DUF1365 domain-containing protein [Allobranchiibius sp. GilTou73]|uniref:DUF1365 domain-containing protein n=1 Tax=Allobranchiibius sp. GilTou73 TaxID=2904523 RepID=UPI001F425671|nr:DUF1365 domain-containing protein [Allobranchiibius sp. GilTou73]UIJ33452.1 DUF1365 domain-containing protein [Allobranchiibius sp. GilTou73]
MSPHPTATAYLTRVRHQRTSPIKHGFSYPGISYLVDLDKLGSSERPAELPWWASAFTRFKASDHLGDPSCSWRDNVTTYAATHGIDLDGGTVRVLTGARSLGYVFNPVSVYWCRDRRGALACVIAEVHNTYGERHAYLVRPDESGRARVGKEFYVSPFNDTDGEYTMSLPEPDDDFAVAITLRRTGERPFATTWTGRRIRGRGETLKAAVATPLASYLVTTLIHLHGVRLWSRRLPIQPRPQHAPQEAV